MARPAIAAKAVGGRTLDRKQDQAVNTAIWAIAVQPGTIEVGDPEATILVRHGTARVSRRLASGKSSARADLFRSQDRGFSRC